MCDILLRRQGSSTTAWKLWHLVSGLETTLQLLKQANHLQHSHDAVLLALFHCKHPSLVTRGPKLYKVWKTKLIVLPGVHHWNNSAASTTWDKSILTSLVTSNQLCNSNKRNPSIPHFAVSFCLSINCYLGINKSVHVRGVSAAGKGRKERQRMRWWLSEPGWTGLWATWSGARSPYPWTWMGMSFSAFLPKPHWLAGTTWICCMQWSWLR